MNTFKCPSCGETLEVLSHGGGRKAETGDGTKKGEALPQVQKRTKLASLSAKMGVTANAAARMYEEAGFTIQLGPETRTTPSGRTTRVRWVLPRARKA
jgi:transposase-like protein